MAMRVTFTAALIAAISLCSGRPAFACSCPGNGEPCEAFYNGAAVFVGTVESFGPGPRETFDRTVRLRVIEALRGVDAGHVDVVTGLGEDECGYPFKRGGTYLVYAYHNQHGLGTGMCTRTRPLDDSEQDLAFARAQASAPAAGGVITGVIRNRDVFFTFPPSANESLFAPIPGIPVQVDCGDALRETVTDDSGRFRVAGLAVGTCQVRFLLPDEMYPESPMPIPVTIRDARACASVTMLAAYDRRIQGRLLDVAGGPVAGVTVDLVERNGVGGSVNSGAVTATDGRFELRRVIEGDHRIGVNTRKGFAHRFPFGTPAYFPGVLDVEHAATVNVRGTQPVDIGDFVLPPTVRFVGVSGIVVHEDGTPASEAVVFLLAGDRPNDEIRSGPIVADADGRFTIAIPPGERAVLMAEWGRSGSPVAGHLRVETGESPPFVADVASDIRIVVGSRRR